MPRKTPKALRSMHWQNPYLDISLWTLNFARKPRKLPGVYAARTEKKTILKIVLLSAVPNCRGKHPGPYAARTVENNVYFTEGC